MNSVSRNHDCNDKLILCIHKLKSLSRHKFLSAAQYFSTGSSIYLRKFSGELCFRYALPQITFFFLGKRISIHNTCNDSFEVASRIMQSRARGVGACSKMLAGMLGNSADSLELVIFCCNAKLMINSEFQGFVKGF